MADQAARAASEAASRVASGASGEQTASVHATAVVIAECGVLIQGPSGAGKSSLAMALVAATRAEGRFGRLVGDDRVKLCVRHGRLIARPHPVLAGRIERRGLGLLDVDFEPAAVIRCVVGLVAPDRKRDIPPRLPSEEDLRSQILGVNLPLIALQQGQCHVDAAQRLSFFIHRL